MHPELELKRFSTVLDNFADEVDKMYLRELQADAHACAANCCRDKESSTKTLSMCVDNCGLKLQNARNIALNELNSLEDRFHRCLSSCEEYSREVKDGNSKEEYSEEIHNGCVTRCVDTAIETIPDFFKAINNALNKSS